LQQDLQQGEIIDNMEHDSHVCSISSVPWKNQSALFFYVAPKAGGSSLACSFSSQVNERQRCLVDRQETVVGSSATTLDFEDGNHATYHEFAQQRSCNGSVYRRYGQINMNMTLSYFNAFLLPTPL
jgi:hypothetical protein